jgi:hypothetical protein
MLEERREYDRQIGRLSSDVAALKDSVDSLTQKVDSLIAVRNQAVGAIAVLGMIGGAIAWAVQAVPGWLHR